MSDTRTHIAGEAIARIARESNLRRFLRRSARIRPILASAFPYKLAVSLGLVLVFALWRFSRSLERI
jgi:hypothetical protein